MGLHVRRSIDIVLDATRIATVTEKNELGAEPRIAFALSTVQASEFELVVFAIRRAIEELKEK